MPPDRHFEDYAVGQIFRAGPQTLDADEIRRFAAAYDPQPQHLDEAAAASSLFGELVASGWHTAAVTMRLIIDSGLLAVPGGAMGAGVETLSWLRPVRPGDALRVENEILAARRSRSRPGKGVISVRTTTFNQRDEPVQTMVSAILVPCRVPG